MKITAQDVVRAPKPLRASVRCTPNDVMLGALPVPVVFWYDWRLDVDGLAHALGRVLGDFGIFSSKLERRGDDVYLACGDVGVSLSVAEDLRTMAEAMGVFDTRESGKLVERVAPGRAMRRGEPLMTVRVTHFAGGASALGICWHHSVGDMHSFMLLMRAWSAVMAGRTYERPLIVEDRVAYLAKALPRRKHVKSGLRELSVLELMRFAGHVLASAPRSRTLRLYFTADELATMRAALAQEAGQDLSTHDAVCGHVYSTIAANDRRVRGRTLGLAVNMRKRVDLPAQLLGNMLGGIHVWSEARASAATIARSIRACVDAFADQHLDYHATAELLSRARGVTKLARFLPHAIDPANGALLSSSWCNFGVYDLDFGVARPRFFSNVGESPLPFINVLQDGLDGRGVLFMTTLPGSIAKRLRGTEGQRQLHRYRSVDTELPALARALPWLA